jgi:hypothetical protein
MQINPGQPGNSDLRTADIRIREIAVYLAGDIAKQIAKEPQPGGWVRSWSERELTTIHEAAHAAEAIICGFTVFNLRVFDGNRAAGFCDFGLPGSSAPADPIGAAESSPNDSEKIAGCVETLAKDGQAVMLPDLKAAVEATVRTHWANIRCLAGELFWRGTLTELEVLHFWMLSDMQVEG